MRRLSSLSLREKPGGTTTSKTRLVWGGAEYRAEVMHAQVGIDARHDLLHLSVQLV